jgi:transcriptional regulator with XRE-family HTH domain
MGGPTVIALDRQKVRAARTAAGYKQAEVSDLLRQLPPGTNASPSRISQIETGVVIWVEELEGTRLAAVLGVPLSMVLLETTPAAANTQAARVLEDAIPVLVKASNLLRMPAPEPKVTALARQHAGTQPPALPTSEPA